MSRRESIALATLFALSLPAVTPRIYSSDEIQYFSYLRSLWFDHDVSFENEYRYFFDRDVARAEGFHATFLEIRTAAGRPPNFGTIGCAILWAPFYLIGDVSARLMRAAGRTVAVDGFSRPYVAAVAYGSAFYGFLAILLSISAARRIVGERHALIAGLLVWVGTPILFYMYVAPPYSHACSAFAVALFVAIWLRIRDRWAPRQMVVLGIAAGLMSMVREQDAFFAIGAAIDWALGFIGGPDKRTKLKGAAAACSAFAVAFLPQLAAYRALNGSPGPSELVARKMNWLAPHALQVLTSPDHGFVFWTPMAVFAIAGLVLLVARGTGDTRRIGAIALIMVALQVYVGGSLESWSAAGAFGQRRFVALTILLTIGLTAFLRAIPSAAWRTAVMAAMAVCVWWNVALAAQFGTHLMNRKQLELGKNAYDAFVTLPRIAPQLAYRYLTDRGSFYRTPRAAQER